MVEIMKSILSIPVQKFLKNPTPGFKPVWHKMYSYVTSFIKMWSSLGHDVNAEHENTMNAWHVISLTQSFWVSRGFFFFFAFAFSLFVPFITKPNGTVQHTFMCMVYLQLNISNLLQDLRANRIIDQSPHYLNQFFIFILFFIAILTKQTNKTYRKYKIELKVIYTYLSIRLRKLIYGYQKFQIATCYPFYSKGPFTSM